MGSPRLDLSAEPAGDVRQLQPEREALPGALSRTRGTGLPRGPVPHRASDDLVDGLWLRLDRFGFSCQTCAQQGMAAMIARMPSGPPSSRSACAGVSFPPLT